LGAKVLLSLKIHGEWQFDVYMRPPVLQQSGKVLCDVRPVLHALKLVVLSVKCVLQIFLCAHAYTYVRTLSHAHTYTHKHPHISTHICTCTCIHTCTHICTQICTHIFTHIHGWWLNRYTCQKSARELMELWRLSWRALSRVTGVCVCMCVCILHFSNPGLIGNRYAHLSNACSLCSFI